MTVPRVGCLHSGRRRGSGRSARTLAAGVLLLAHLALARRAQPQVIFVPQPSSAEVAAGQRDLRRQEAAFAGRLRRNHGDPRAGEALGEALRARESIRLDHPSAALLASIGGAADPYALALAIAADASWGGAPATYEIDVLLFAVDHVGSAARKATVWAKAAALEGRDRALRLAFLTRAYDVLGAVGFDAPAGTCDLDLSTRVGPLPPVSGCMVAGARVEELLDAGLPHEAVSVFDALPAVVREQLLAAWAAPDDLRLDRRLGLAAARLLDGDADGARALLARTGITPWDATAPRRADGEAAASAAVLRAALERLLAAPAADDPFPLLSEFVGADLFGLGPRASGVATAAFARLAERESYPEFARFAWTIARGGAETDTDTPAALPPDVATDAARWRGLLAAQASAFANAAQVAAHAAPRRPAVHCEIDCDRLDRSQLVTILAMDRSGQRGVAILESPPAFGELFRIELRDGTLVAVRASLWQS